MPSKKITSWDQLQEQIGSILQKINDNQALALAAATNPLHAIEELGYEIAPQAKIEIEQRLRFGTKIASKLRKLRKNIFEHSDHSFDLNSPKELRKVLFEELKLSPSDKERPTRLN